MASQPFPRAIQPQKPRTAWLAKYKYTCTVSLILLAHVGLIGLQRHYAPRLAPILALVLYFLAFLFVLIRDRSWMSRSILTIGVLALLLSGIDLYTSGKSLSLAISVAGHAFFLFFLVVFILSRLFRDKAVSADNIMAGIIVYLLLAELWTQFYILAVLLDPGAIFFAHRLGTHSFLTFYYFSVTTLTTAGLGDVHPVSDLARMLTAYEALVGQIYLGVFVALLMGRHLSRK